MSTYPEALVIDKSIEINQPHELNFRVSIFTCIVKSADNVNKKKYDVHLISSIVFIITCQSNAQKTIGKDEKMISGQLLINPNIQFDLMLITRRQI